MSSIGMPDMLQRVETCSDTCLDLLVGKAPALLDRAADGLPQRLELGSLLGSERLHDPSPLLAYYGLSHSRCGRVMSRAETECLIEIENGLRLVDFVPIVPFNKKGRYVVCMLAVANGNSNCIRFSST